MAALKLTLLAAVVLGLVVIKACNDSDEDEKRASHSNGTAQTATPQKPGEKHESDQGEEGEEGPAIPAAVAAEKPAPLQAHGQQLVYNFDSDSNGQLPGKFHAARTGSGAESKCVVMSDAAAPSRPNVVAQTSTDRTEIGRAHV